MCVMAFNEVAVMSLPLEKMQSAEVRERKWSALSKRDLNGDQADGRGRSRTLNVKGIQLDDLSEIQVLGEGSFGRVTLVQDVNRSELDQSSMWALKKMSKRKLDDLKQK